MNYFDWIIIIIYITVIMGIAFYLTRSQQNTEDYYLGGRKIKWWQAGASTMATQLGAISFISAPAFVALKQGGGLKWLSYEFGVPLALIVVMAVIIPKLYIGNYISIYEYLEDRFDSGTRSLVSLLFQIGRGLATAVTVLAGALIISTALSISTISAIIILSVVTIIYDVIGGIRVVIISDVLQMVIIIAGIAICGGVALYLVGLETAWATFSSDRFQILDFDHWGISAEGSYGFWPMTIGGLFLYASYYGTDQSQVQRELTVGSINDARKSLLMNALGRFPMVLMYCLMGVFVGTIFASPESLIHIASVMKLDPETLSNMLQNDPDRMMPLFIFSYLPHGVIGFIFVAIMAALMSSLDSGLNSLSAVTMKDFYQKYIRPDSSERHNLIASKIITLIWGIFCVIVAIIFASIGEATRHTTIVLINAVGSMLYGPILAAFLLGIWTKSVGAREVKLGVVAGILFNICLWIFTDFSWLWWNVSGFVTTFSVAFLISILFGTKEVAKFSVKDSIDERDTSSKIWPKIYVMMVFYFFLIIFISYLLQSSQ